MKAELNGEPLQEADGDGCFGTVEDRPATFVAAELFRFAMKQLDKVEPYSMQAIIDKLKAAKEPSRELDRAIFDAVADGNFWPEHRAFWRAASMSSREPIDFTSSMDAAILLIPDGMFWVLGMGRTRPDEPLAGCNVVKPGDQLNPIGEAEGDHLAICICIAALEARHSLQTQR